MKTKIFALALLLFSVGGYARGQQEKKDKLLFLLRNKEHISQAVRTIVELQSCKESTVNADTAVIIVCGEAVSELTTTAAKEWLQQLSGVAEASIVACGLSMEKFKIPETALVPGIQLTKNGLITAFELQKRGYLSIEL